MEWKGNRTMRRCVSSRRYWSLSPSLFSAALLGSALRCIPLLSLLRSLPDYGRPEEFPRGVLWALTLSLSLFLSFFLSFSLSLCLSLSLSVCLSISVWWIYGWWRPVSLHVVKAQTRSDEGKQKRCTNLPELSQTSLHTLIKTGSPLEPNAKHKPMC